MWRRLQRKISKLIFYMKLRNKVKGRLKLRGDVSGISVDSDFFCDGDLWLGVYKNGGKIAISSGVRASGPLTITAINEVFVGNNCLFGPNVFITDHFHGIPGLESELNTTPSTRDLYSPAPTLIKNSVLVGTNCTILPKAFIENNAVIGANSVVNCNIPTGEVWAGSPVRRIMQNAR